MIKSRVNPGPFVMSAQAVANIVRAAIPPTRSLELYIKGP